MPSPVLEGHRGKPPSYTFGGGQLSLQSSTAEFLNPGSTGQGYTPSHSASSSLTVTYLSLINTVTVVDGIGTTSLNVSGTQRNGFWPVREQAKKTNTCLKLQFPFKLGNIALYN